MECDENTKVICRCRACKHAHKVEDAEYDKTYECTADTYDLEAYTCFEEK